MLAKRGILSAVQGRGRPGAGPHTTGEAFVREQLAHRLSRWSVKPQLTTGHMSGGHIYFLPPSARSEESSEGSCGAGGWEEGVRMTH